MSRFLIITNVIHAKENGQYFGYAPYINEMNIWIKFTDKVTVVAPLANRNITPIDLAYDCNNLTFRKVPDFSFTTLKSRLVSLIKLPIIFYKILIEMYRADHIHLRCPGNMGLVGCFAQILFPSKAKTAKYAGNWDPKSKQPWSYRLQKYILSNTFFTRNMTVLVYGKWQNQSKNIKSFFTATYLDIEKSRIEKSILNEKIIFIFTGSLVSGKNPMYALVFVNELLKSGYDVQLNLFGEGSERFFLENFIKENKLEKSIFLHGNQNKDVVKNAYQKSHFVILPSKSEGWPKTIAEGMFWGCVPVATKVSCVPFMLDFGNRGILLEMDLEKDIEQITKIFESEEKFQEKSIQALEWSQHYTTDLFEAEIKTLLV